MNIEILIIWIKVDYKIEIVFPVMDSWLHHGTMSC